jgi:hypothetical protein
MSDKGGYAFPCPETDTQYGQYGMTLRDYFAAAALPGCVDFFNQNPVAATTHSQRMNCSQADMMAKLAYELADSMLAVREATNA